MSDKIDGISDEEVVTGAAQLVANHVGMSIVLAVGPRSEDEIASHVSLRFGDKIPSDSGLERALWELAERCGASFRQHITDVFGGTTTVIRDVVQAPDAVPSKVKA